MGVPVNVEYQAQPQPQPPQQQQPQHPVQVTAASTTGEPATSMVDGAASSAPPLAFGAAMAPYPAAGYIPGMPVMPGGDDSCALQVADSMM